MKSCRGMMLVAMLALAAVCQPAEADWIIDWYSIDSGGTMDASGGEWTLKGTIGQPDATKANALAGGGWSLTGGFWGFVAEVLNRIFSDRYEQP